MQHTPILPASAPLSALEHFLPSQVGAEPLIAVAAALRGFDREQLGSAIEVLIALLDVAEGDPDAETGNDVEDDFVLSENAIERAGDPAVDCVDQDAGAYVEWHSTHPGKRTQCFTAGHEDAEEDDDSGQCTEDEISCGWPLHGRSGPGCMIADNDTEHDGREEEGR